MGGVHSGRVPATHVGRCGVCWKWVSLRRDGRLVPHRFPAAPDGTAPPCAARQAVQTMPKAR